MSSDDATHRPKPNAEPLLRVEDLSTSYHLADSSAVKAVRDVSFDVERGQIFGIVGESGCGKTTVARSLIGLLDENGEITSGSVILNDRDVTELPEPELRSMRWSEIAMIPQNVMNALNPVKPIGDQIVDVVQLHTDRSAEAARAHAEMLFETVGLDPDRLSDYAHEFSGGMLQRAVIAMAISCEPDLIIADEPTTALDVVIQDTVLEELRTLRKEFDISLLVISHDIGVMAELCDTLAVMYGGEIMERGTAVDIFAEPCNPYTLGLLNSFPNIADSDRELVAIPGTAPDLTDPPSGCVFRERCPFATPECERKPKLYTGTGSSEHVSRCHYVDESDRMRVDARESTTWSEEAVVADSDFEPSDESLIEVSTLRKYFDTSRGVWDYVFRQKPTPVRAVDGIDFDIKHGEIFGIVGESGCGKSTLGRLLLNLLDPTEGEITFDGRDISEMATEQKREFKRSAQIIFQDPFGSLNPRLTVQQTLHEPLKLLGDRRHYAERLARIKEMLTTVGLTPATTYLNRFPGQLSGGERQRVAIARALVVDPSFIVADEPVSMLDVSIRANILNLLRRLRLEHDLTYSIISHDISLVRTLCDRIAVMYLGEFVELGDTAAIVDDPKHPYTQALVASVPRLDPTQERASTDIEDEVPSARDPPSGCRFHTRCPKVIPPDNYEFTQERFREVMNLRSDLINGTIRVDAPASATDDEIATQIGELKAAYFSGEFRDSDAESVIDDALETLVRDDVEAAVDRLATEFASPCERDNPELRETPDGRLVACHLY